MKQDEAERLARKLRPDDTDEGLHYDDFRALCDYILSGDMKREIENAAYRHAASIAASHVKRFNGLQIAEAIEALIQRSTQKETSHEH